MNKYVLITGGSSGLGYEFAKLFAKDGYNLILVARSLEKLETVKLELSELYGIKVIILNDDLSNEMSCVKVCDYVDKNNLYIKYMVNNAGIGTFGYFNETKLERDLELIDINIKATTILTKRMISIMLKQGEGGILNISSTAAFIGGPKMNTYYASKAYVLSLSEALYEEMKDRGVVVSCYCPGAFKTEFQIKSGINKNKKAEKYLMGVEEVAQIGYRGFLKGKAIIIPGFKNKVLVMITKIIPRSISRKIILKMNS